MPRTNLSKARLEALKAAAVESETKAQWAYDNQREVYHERDMLVRALSFEHPSHLMRHRGKSGHSKPVVCINHRTAGQMCWTLIGGDEAALKWFRHLEWQDNDWDGHKTADRYQRLESIGLAGSR